MSCKLSLMVLLILPLLMGSSGPAGDAYLSPGEIAVSTDGHWIYVLCEQGDQLLAIDAATLRVEARVEVAHLPRGLALAPDGKWIYVASSWTDKISVISRAKLEVVRELTAGFEPTGLAVDHSGSSLYVANRISNDISVIDLASGQETKRLLAGRGSSYLAAAEGKIFGTHVYPRIGPQRTAPQSEITVVDTVRQVVEQRIALPNIAGVFHIAVSSDGRLGVAAQLRPKNLIPLAHVEHGWAFTNSLTVFGEDVAGAIQVPLDELDRYYALPFGVAISPDKLKIFVSTAGSDSVTVIDVAKLIRFANSRPRPFANDLSASANYVAARIPVGRNPRGLALSPDGSHLYVANRMDDTINVIATDSNKVISTIDLGGPKTFTPLRRGERIFNSARYSFQGQFGCANCHIDTSFDGLEWDLEPDGFGIDIVDNRLLEDLRDTEPFKWNGGNPNMPTECGPRTEKYFYRSQSYDERELADLVSYVRAQPFRPNRHRLPGGELAPAQERGKAIFKRSMDKTGKPIAERNQCNYCHTGPKYTNQKSFDVGTGKTTDRSPLVDVPQLNNVYLTAPYLHDGSARSLEEIWTVFNPNDSHGRTNDLTKDELNDLIEYLRTL
jgi:YVTN family beta-propeller protein